ncbi:MAG: S-layer homology domain-containing protein [Lachnospiraceae bacterium]|nr:S-layer homology domain-containing protein [Lachnospiraceae bacterium]
MGSSGRTVRAAPTNETAQTLQLAEAPPGLAAQQAYEIWLTTALADTVNRSAYEKELAEWKRLHTETIGDYAAYMSGGALYTAVAADTAAKKAEAGILNRLRKLITAAKEALDKATYEETVVVKEAWDEEVLVQEAWDEVVREAYDETVREAYDEIVKEAYDETIEVEGAWDEPVYEGFYVCARCQYTTQDGLEISRHCRDAHKAEGGASYSVEPVQTGIITHPAVSETIHHEAEVIHHEAEVIHHEAEVVHHEAEYTVVHHDAETAVVPHDNSEELGKYEEALDKADTEAGPIEGLDGLDLETGFITVIKYLDGKLAEKQTEVEESQAKEKVALEGAETAKAAYEAKKALCDAAFADLKEAVSQAVEASFLIPEGEYFIFSGAGGNTVMDIAGGSTANGANVRIYTYNRTDAQKFRIVHNDDGTVSLISAKSGKALDAAGRGIFLRTNIQQYTSNGSAAQKWVVTDTDGDGLYTIKASYTSMVVDTKDSSSKSGTNVHLYSTNGAATQEWRFAEPASVYFTDVTDPNAWYYKAVYWALANNITSGYGEGTFQPNATVTRAQVVQFLYNIAGRPSIEGLKAESFRDVKENAWYYNAVTWASANGITSGYGEGTFQPNALCTRAMIAKFLRQYAAYIGEDTDVRKTVTFSDVKENAWYHDAVIWAAEQGLTTGYGSGQFQPNATCTRAMMVTFLQRAAWAA